MKLSKKFIKFLSFFILNSKKRKKFRADFDMKKLIERDKMRRKIFHMGFGSYTGELFYAANPEKIRIGKYCSIANDVHLGLSQHPIDCLTTHGFITNKTNPRFEGLLDVLDNVIDYPDAKLWPPVIIGNDVWIGYRAIIMDGVNIGDGAIVAAGAVVTKDVQPYTIVGGVPAKPIGMRFSDIAGGGGGDTRKIA